MRKKQSEKIALPEGALCGALILAQFFVARSGFMSDLNFHFHS